MPSDDPDLRDDEEPLDPGDLDLGLAPAAMAEPEPEPDPEPEMSPDNAAADESRDEPKD